MTSAARPRSNTKGCIAPGPHPHVKVDKLKVKVTGKDPTLPNVIQLCHHIRIMAKQQATPGTHTCISRVLWHLQFSATSMPGGFLVCHFKFRQRVCPKAVSSQHVVACIQIGPVQHAFWVHMCHASRVASPWPAAKMAHFWSSHGYKSQRASTNTHTSLHPGH